MMTRAPMTYAGLLALYQAEERAKQNAAIVNALQSRQQMRAEFRKVFDRFAEFGPIAIVGSSLRNWAAAKDVDLLFPADTDFRKLARELGLKYLGKFPSPLTKGDVRRLSNITVEGVGKPIQIISDSSVTTAAEWPHAALTPDGKLLNADKHYVKPAADAA
jgi:hypothetical protein